MKKLFITAAAMMAFAVCGAQLVTVESVQRVGNALGEKAVISPDGQFVVTNTMTSLKRVNVSDGTEKVIANGEGLYNYAVSSDGATVVYSRPQFKKNHLRYVSLESVDATGSAPKVLVKASRKLGSGYSLSNGSLNAVENGKLRTKALGAAKATAAPVASINYGHLDVTVNGKTTTIDPQGRGSYIWPSISPDGTRVCYWLIGGGCFTCNLDGSDVKSHGALRAATWAGDNMLVGMDEVEGDSQKVASCSIVALDVNTNRTQKLTDDTVIATYPSASADGSRIAFTTPAGEIYVINVVK